VLSHGRKHFSPGEGRGLTHRYPLNSRVAKGHGGLNVMVAHGSAWLMAAMADKSVKKDGLDGYG